MAQLKFPAFTGTNKFMNNLIRRMLEWVGIVQPEVMPVIAHLTKEHPNKIQIPELTAIKPRKRVIPVAKNYTEFCVLLNRHRDGVGAKKFFRRREFLFHQR